jgi:hypothetical protein
VSLGRGSGIHQFLSLPPTNARQPKHMVPGGAFADTTSANASKPPNFPSPYHQSDQSAVPSARGTLAEAAASPWSLGAGLPAGWSWGNRTSAGGLRTCARRPGARRVLLLWPHLVAAAGLCAPGTRGSGPPTCSAASSLRARGCRRLLYCLGCAPRGTEGPGSARVLQLRSALRFPGWLPSSSSCFSSSSSSSLPRLGLST